MRPAPELIAWIESLTSPDAEDWQIVLAGKKAHVMALHEDPTPMGRKLVNMALFEVSIDELKRRVKEYPVNQTRGGRPIGCISVVICQDDFERGNYFANWLANQARKRNFSVLSITARSSTADAVALQRECISICPQGFTRFDDLEAGHA